MRRSSIVLAAAALTACGGHTSSPSPAATPAAASGRTAAPAGPPTTLRYAPGSGRYRIESVVHSVTEVMGQSQVVDATTTMLISSTTASDASGNIAATFVVDSATATGQVPGIGTPDVSALRGKTFHAVFTSAGRPVSLTVPDTTDPIMVQMGETFREFLPTLPPAQIAGGATWTDTTSNATRQGGNNIRTRSIRTHRVVGWEQQGGVNALHISTTGAYTITGDGEAQGQAITMSGAGTATSERFVSAAGAFQSLSASDSANINVTVVSMGLEIPVRQSRRSTITRLP